MSASNRRVTLRKWAPHAAAAIVLGVLLVWDKPLLAAIQAFRSPFLTWLTERVSQLRGATFPCAVALLLIAIGLLRKRPTVWHAGIAMLLTVLLTGALTSVMKEAIARPGPIPDSPLVTGRSLFDERFGRFPSSHSAMTFGAAIAVAAFLPAAAVPAFVLAVLVCYERLYRGTHFPSDIFAGIWIGVVSAQFVIVQLARRKGWTTALAREHTERRTREVTTYAWADEQPDESDREPRPLGPTTSRPSADDERRTTPASPSA